MCFIGILIVEKNRYILIKIFNYVLMKDNIKKVNDFFEVYGLV